MTDCGCRVENGTQVLWCIEHNGWKYARQMDKARIKAAAALTAQAEAIANLERFARGFYPWVSEKVDDALYREFGVWLTAHSSGGNDG